MANEQLDAAISNLQEVVVQSNTEMQQAVALMKALVEKVKAIPGAPDTSVEEQALANLGNSLAASNAALQTAIDAAKPVTGA